MSLATVHMPSVQVTGCFPVDPAEIANPDDLLAHIDAAIVSCLGPRLPVFTALSIVRAFWERFTLPQIMSICDRAFNVHRAMWQMAPVTVLRFQENEDRFFALPLLEEARIIPAGIA